MAQNSGSIRRPHSLWPRSGQLTDEPDDQGRHDEEHHGAHSRSRSPVTGGTSRLPIPPPDIRFHVGDDRSVIRHWSASSMLSDMVGTAGTQTGVTAVLSTCIFTVYGPALRGAVRDCTGKPTEHPTQQDPVGAKSR